MSSHHSTPGYLYNDDGHRFVCSRSNSAEGSGYQHKTTTNDGIRKSGTSHYPIYDNQESDDYLCEQPNPYNHVDYGDSRSEYYSHPHQAMPPTSNKNYAYATKNHYDDSSVDELSPVSVLQTLYRYPALSIKMKEEEMMMKKGDRRLEFDFSNRFKARASIDDDRFSAHTTTNDHSIQRKHRNGSQKSSSTHQDVSLFSPLKPILKPFPNARNDNERLLKELEEEWTLSNSLTTSSNHDSLAKSSRHVKDSNTKSAFMGSGYPSNKRIHTHNQNVSNSIHSMEEESEDRKPSARSFVRRRENDYLTSSSSCARRPIVNASKPSTTSSRSRSTTFSSSPYATKMPQSSSSKLLRKVSPDNILSTSWNENSDSDAMMISNHPYIGKKTFPTHSSSDPSMISPATTIHRDEHYVEVYPGLSVPLRGANETLRAIESDYYIPFECTICDITICCIQDAEYVLCPKCRVIAPIIDDNDNSKDQNISHHHHHNASGQVTSRKRIGVGLGFTLEDLCQTIIKRDF